ncbi:MAG: transporter [Flavobacteriales bacterium]|nr:transporter [Flavobacteriales bacterium]
MVAITLIKRKNRTINTLLLLFTFGTMSAQIVTDRPDQTESSLTVPKGALQLESGLLVNYEGDANTITRQFLLPTNLFRYGISERVELRLLNQFESVKSDQIYCHGISDLEIGTKIQLFKKEKSKTDIAFLSHLMIPTGTRTISSNAFGSINKLCISHELSEDIAIGYNLGYNYFGTDLGNLTYSFSLAVRINDQVGIYAEPYGELICMKQFISNFDAGFTYLAKDNLQFDFSFGAGLNQHMNYISVGCSWLMLKTQFK